MRSEKQPKKYSIAMSSTVYDTLVNIDKMLEPLGYEVILWDGSIYPYYSFSIADREDRVDHKNTVE